MARDNWRVILQDFFKMFCVCLVIWAVVAYVGYTYILK